MDKAQQGEKGGIKRTDNADYAKCHTVLGTLDRYVHAAFQPLNGLIQSIVKPLDCLIQLAFEPFDRLFQPSIAPLDRLLDIGFGRGEIGLG